MSLIGSVLRAAAMSLTLSACGGGGGGDGGHGPAHLVEHAWGINAEQVDGAQEMLVKPGTSIDTEVYAFANLGPLVTYPAGELGAAIAEVYATAAGDVYWVSTQALVGDLSDPASVIGSGASLIQSQGDGKIVVAGYATTGTGAAADADFAVARYNSNGTLDTSFGSGGKARTNIAGKFDSAQGLVLQSDGKVVLAGRVGVDGGSDPDFGVVRYNTDGALDKGFGAGGIVRTDFGLGNWEEANDVAVQPDGRLVVAGSVRVGTAFNFGLARFNVDGTPDTVFGTGGLVTTAFSTQGDSSRALALQADGKIVVVGQDASLGTNPDMAIARYLATDGSLDAAFGSAGKVTVDFFGAIDGAEGVAIQADGKIVVGGFARNAGTTGFALARMAP